MNSEQNGAAVTDPTEKLVEAMARVSYPGWYDLPDCDKEHHRDRMHAALTALRQAEAQWNWQLVPRRPTEEMGDAVEALRDAFGAGMTDDLTVWRAFLDAAPKPPGAA